MEKTMSGGIYANRYHKQIPSQNPNQNTTQRNQNADESYEIELNQSQEELLKSYGNTKQDVGEIFQDIDVTLRILETGSISGKGGTPPSLEGQLELIDEVEGLLEQLTQKDHIIDVLQNALTRQGIKIEEIDLDQRITSLARILKFKENEINRMIEQRNPEEFIESEENYEEEISYDDLDLSDIYTKLNWGA